MTALNRDIAWGAGFWEGEGSTHVHATHKRKDGSKYKYPYVSASQKERECLDSLKELFGGCVSLRAKKNQTIWGWTAGGNTAERFYQKVWPYLSERRKNQITKVRKECYLRPRSNQ